MPDTEMVPLSAAWSSGFLAVDSHTTYQEILGFGGAFTEAAAVNWRKMSPRDQARTMHLYFADPSEGGHGYTTGRVPIGSSDFSPASYNFNNVSGDSSMRYFDHSVAHDEASGMLPMILAAQAKVRARGHSLNIMASPWSPPAWMKLPVEGRRSMLGSALPVGLDPTYQPAWAKYLSDFVHAYRSRGVNLWGLTIQNEPENNGRWESCVFTPEYTATFVRDHLGPLLRVEHPEMKILGFDHNKDHVLDWAQVLYKDPEARKYFDGVAFHWYGGLNQQNLQDTHDLAPDKFILASEACNCGGVAFSDDAKTWWSRAEKLAIDMLVDLRFWAIGWTDWNLVVDTAGGPNHVITCAMQTSLATQIRLSGRIH
jgi:glucosylceramidase